MSRYEARLAADKESIRERVAAVGEQVRAALTDAVRGLLKADHPLSYRVILGDLPINREIRAIDARCHAFVARHLPSAGHLRFVSSAMRMTVALERIGDYAVTVGRESVQLSAPPPKAIAKQLSILTDEAGGMLHQAMQAFVDQDADLARSTKPIAGDIHRTYDRIFRQLVQESFDRPLKDLFCLLVVFNHLERVSDQAKNICEETLFEVAGETKPPKIYQVLFVDHTNTVLGPLATAIARKSFPNSGAYHTAGYAPGKQLLPELKHHAGEIGLDLAEIEPVPLPSDAEALAGYHVVVALSSRVREHIGELPFHTVFLQWELPSLDGQDGGTTAERLTDISHRLSDEIRELMVTLRGEDAD